MEWVNERWITVSRHSINRLKVMESWSRDLGAEIGMHSLMVTLF